MRYIPAPETLEVLDYVEDALSIRRWEHEFDRQTPERRSDTAQVALPSPDLVRIRRRLLRANWAIQCTEISGDPLFRESDPARFDWLCYLEESKVIPVYDDAIAVMCQHRLVEPREIVHLLRFITVSGSGYGVDDAENHNYGYHFHFGKVRGNKLRRFNLVLTFDCRVPPPAKLHDPLFAEEHGSGRYDHVDVGTIGANVRLPVYTICEHEMQRIGRDKFKHPAKKAGVFY
jgi:hypothetical protein